jgi:hypothetical protein
MRASALGIASLSLPAAGAQNSKASGAANLGINLAPIRYWMSERPFKNLFKTCGPPISMRRGGRWNDGGPLALDNEGWIRSFAPGQHSVFVIDLKRGHPNTIYDLGYQGPPGALQLMGGKGAKGRVFEKRTPEARLSVRVLAPVRNVVVRERGHRAGGTFASSFVERCRQYSVLRFMDWLRSNDDRAMDWNTRVTDRYYSQGIHEVALEYLVELCQLTSASMWYCVHHRADDGYVRQVAQFLKQRLPSERPIYVEHSNEVWNGQFAQHHYCREKNNNDWLTYHVQRTAQIAELFREQGLDVVAVLGLQSAGTANARRALERDLPPSINATAIAPYFGGHICRDAEIVQRVRAGGFEALFEECRRGIEMRRAEVQQHRELTNSHGLQLLAYEGGQHLVAIGPQRRDPQLVDFLVQANRHPEMYELYRDYLRMWSDETDNSLMCLFHSVSTPDKSGCWGLQEYEGQPASQAPKYRAVLEALGLPTDPSARAPGRLDGRPGTTTNLEGTPGLSEQLE